LTHRGAIRAINEDAVSVGNELLDETRPKFSAHLDAACPLMMIADGMGGHAHGATASRAAIQFIHTIAKMSLDRPAVERTICAANKHLYDLMAIRPEFVGMGTTIVGALFTASGIVHFNVGDSRLYRHRKGKLVLLSCDDVPVEIGHSRRSSHAITQSLGGRPRPTAIISHVGSTSVLERGDKILLCSDGLTDMVRDAVISETLDKSVQPESGAEALFDLAMKAGGQDNISIIVAQAN
jgi:serine/threonine protein phosphatase PrpC